MWLYSFHCKNSLLITLLLLVSCAVPTVKGGEVQKSAREHIKISDMTLSFTTPSLKLSKDFGPTRLIKDIDLSQVTERKTLFHGYFDGPRYQLLSVTGTLRIWLEIIPWSSELTNVVGCDAKAISYVDQKFIVEKERYKRWEYKYEPEFDISNIIIAGRNSLRYKILTGTDRSIEYIIPLNDVYLLRLMLDSIDNSKKLAGWQELSEREQENFLQSLELTGADNGCN